MVIRLPDEAPPVAALAAAAAASLAATPEAAKFAADDHAFALHAQIVERLFQWRSCKGSGPSCRSPSKRSAVDTRMAKRTARFRFCLHYGCSTVLSACGVVPR